MPRTTQLYEYHSKNGKLTEFSGFEMPLWYSSITEEHMAVRNSGGLFDVSHMGRVAIRGKGATEFLSELFPTDCNKVKDARSFYTVICNEAGGILDDVITNKFSSTYYLIIINAGNRAKDISWMHSKIKSFDAQLEELSDDSALIAFQGPKTGKILQTAALDSEVCKLRRFAFTRCKVFGTDCLVSRTGYTGEDGYEILVFDSANNDTKPLKIWNGLLNLGKTEGILPCGLGARDTLRLEAGMCLYGQDIDEKTSPLEASLESLVEFDSHNFTGKEALQNQKGNGIEKKRVCFNMLEQGIPRHGYQIEFSERPIGLVTSGTHSPLLKMGIGMGYVLPAFSSLGQKLSIKIRENNKISEVRQPPLYDTTRFGYKRKM